MVRGDREQDGAGHVRRQALHDPRPGLQRLALQPEYRRRTSEAGTATFAFTDADNGNFNCVIGAVNRTKKTPPPDVRAASNLLVRYSRRFDDGHELSGSLVEEAGELRVRLGHQSHAPGLHNLRFLVHLRSRAARRCGSSSRRRRPIPTCTRAIFIGLGGRNRGVRPQQGRYRRKSAPRRSRSRTAQTRPSRSRSSLPGWPRRSGNRKRSRAKSSRTGHHLQLNRG